MSQPLVATDKESILEVRDLSFYYGDFRGLNNRAFDGRGNYNMGVKEQIIFPEIDYDKIDVLRGMDICITTTARSDDEGRALLEAFRFPLRT